MLSALFRSIYSYGYRSQKVRKPISRVGEAIRQTGSPVHEAIMFSHL